MTEKMWDECPECGSDNWQCADSDWEYDEEYGERELECLDCGCIWKWVYKFFKNQIVISGGRDDDDFGTTSGSPLDLTEDDFNGNN